MALLRAVVDLLFPPVCRVCRQRGEFPLCSHCIDGFPLIRPPICVRCGHPVPGPPEILITCMACRHRRPDFRIGRSAGIYDGSLREAIHALKFQRCAAIAGPLGAIMAEVSRREPAYRAVDLIVPVPLHPARRRERGFNQAELLASIVARELGVPCDPALLRRTSSRQSQVGLPASGRRTNVLGAFASEARAAGGSVLLVDDVISSGATAAACATVLQGAGAREVLVLTAARAVLH